ncbi:GTP pyrophosphokinase family protein [Terrilactibacillus sp. BCM23-1]|uniref:GTP diphosphokinase n=1 Tax=Terrilactibacillus tamarindi TaxID=2599694 RepID=A0A6N8CL53_9BACI|nr:GTP pyrophosphokinase family protein [Terrilactibacillus tamarindi]MTT30582.1 GTP pyrophosphokinase family protein [Terrilactibacillus tamarindi]
MKWDEFLAPYTQAVNELKIKLRGYRDLYEVASQHSPIEFVTGRVKPVASIQHKARKKGIPIHKIQSEIQDIAGVRVMCQFVDDINTVIKLIRSRTDFKIIEEKNYIDEQKKSGYRSFHFIVDYPVQTIHGEHKILAEIQIRTLAMNFWATIEHSLNYKYEGRIPEEIQTRLLRAAEAAFRLDEEMSNIREEIQIAQQHFRAKEQEKDNKIKRPYEI